MIWKLNKFKKYFYDIFANKLKTPLNATLGFLSSAYNYTEIDNANIYLQMKNYQIQINGYNIKKNLNIKRNKQAFRNYQSFNNRKINKFLLIIYVNKQFGKIKKSYLKQKIIIAVIQQVFKNNILKFHHQIIGTEFKFKLVAIENKTTEGSQEQITIGLMLKQKSNRNVKNRINQSMYNQGESQTFKNSIQVENEPCANTPINNRINQPEINKTPTTIKRVRSSFTNSGLIDYDKLILIVDGEPFNHDILILMMKNMGYKQLLKAYNGQQAIDIIKEKEDEISIIIMDLDMLIMGEIEAIKVIVQLILDQKLDCIPIIDCIAHDDKETMDKCMQAGMQCVVVKPVFGKSLREAFQQITNSDDVRKQSVLCLTSQLQI